MRPKHDFPKPASRPRNIQGMNDTRLPKVLDASGSDSIVAKDEQTFFHLFPKLPIELRLKVWSLALPRRRIIKIERKSTKETEDKKHTLWGFRNNPPMLQACHESRSVVLRGSHLSFQAHLQHPIFFNPQMDVLWMQDLDVLGQFFSATKYPPTMEVTTVRTLVVGDPLRHCSATDVLGWHEPLTQVRQAISRFGALEEVIILRSNNSQVSMREYNASFWSTEFQTNLERAMGGWKNWYVQQSRETWKEERKVETPRVIIISEEKLEAWVEGDFVDHEFDEIA